MTDNSRVVLAAAIGASLGCVAGYLFWTQPGRVLRRRIEFGLDDLARELVQVRGLFANAASVATEGRQILEDFNERGSQQTRPF